MFNPEPLQRKARVKLAATSVACAALLAAAAQADIAGPAGREPSPTHVGAAEPARPTHSYRLRCWQNGRMIIDESTAELGSDSAAADLWLSQDLQLGRLRALVLANAPDTTCLVKAQIAAPAAR